MAINISQNQFGKPLQAETPYRWRVISASAKETKTHKLRLNLSLSVADGPSKGQVVFFSPFQFMYWYFNEDDVANLTRAENLYIFLSKRFGVELDELKQYELPGAANEHTDLLDYLLNLGFEAEVKWVPASDDYEGKWEIGRVIRPLGEGSFVPSGWDAFQDDAEQEEQF